MRHLGRRLEQQQAVIGVETIDAAAQAIACQGEVVLLRRMAEQRQPQAALALEGAVAGARGASRAAEQRCDVALEVHLAQLGAAR